MINKNKPLRSLKGILYTPYFKYGIFGIIKGSYN